MKTDWLSYVDRLESRSLADISLVVIHATELPDLAMAREFGERIVHADSSSGNSGHYYIDRDGTTEQWVPLARVAHHVRGHNANSIGIELVHVGRWPDWFDSRHQSWATPYPRVQIDALITLLNELQARLPDLGRMAGHDELDTDWIAASDDAAKRIRRKLDPGPTFPWGELEAEVSLKRLSELGTSATSGRPTVRQRQAGPTVQER